MDWLMLILRSCSDCEEPTMLQRPATWIECAEQARLLDAGYSLLTEWDGVLRPIAASTCIPMDEARAAGLVAEAGS